VPDQQEQQKEVVRRLFMEGLGKGDLSVADEVLSPDFVNLGGLGDSATGPEVFKATIGSLRGAFSDIAYELPEMISEGSRVAVRYVMTGVHTAEFMGVEATGRTVTYDSMAFFRFVDGKVVERQGLVQDLALMRELGAL
jgi:predicted ester cyclase